ncbi:UNVERIFIED_CONTAM: hypothetical protein GTU68_057602, partial [Idotea baltica]|nr:hypothetical protein [Idotea baltica]
MTETKGYPELHAFGDLQEGSKGSKGCCYGLKKINHALVRLFYWFGYQVGLRPLYFIIIPTIICSALATGLLFIVYEENPMVLFVPFTAPFIREQRIVETHFPMNYSHFYDPTRFTRHEGHSRVLVSAKDGETIFRTHLWPEIMELDERIRNLTVTGKDGQELRYEDICAKWLGRCMDNAALNVNQIVGEIENGSTIINYPLMIVPFIVPQLLGGAVINETAGTVEDAKSILTAYFLDIGDEEKKELSDIWEIELLRFLRDLDYEYIKPSYYASRSIGDELKIKMDSCIPYIPLTGFIMVTACMALLWMSDCVRCKPLIGVVGIISAVMSTGAA